MTFDFDRVIDRRGTGSEKWDKYSGRDVIPLWVADSDFMVPPAVIAALEERVRHGVFGYGAPSSELNEAAVAVCVDEWGWDVDPAWFVWLPGLVCGINVTCRAVGESGSGVASLTPVYPPFLSAPKLMDRRLITVPLAGDNLAGWAVDAGRLEVVPTTSEAAGGLVGQIESVQERRGRCCCGATRTIPWAAPGGARNSRPWPSPACATARSSAATRSMPSSFSNRA